MKKTFLLLFLICIFGCNNDDNKPSNPIDKLPPATQTGQGTFACLVDGKPFIDKSGSPNNLNFNCFYQYIDGGYYFSVGGNNENLNPRGIYIQTEKKEIFEGETYQLVDLQDGNVYGGGGFSFSITENYQSYTNSQYTGELSITKLDFQNHIVSGTFWFDLKNPKTGKTVEIREGRFDTNFGF